MSINIKLFRDKNGIMHAEALPPYDLLATYLVHDIQSSLFHSQEVLDLVKKVKNNEIKNEKMIGNAFRLSLDKKGAKIESLFDDNLSINLSLLEFEQAIDDWLKLLENSKI